MGKPHPSHVGWSFKKDVILGEVKHLSNQGKENNSDSQSSGERNGKSPNFRYVIGYSRYTGGVVGNTSATCNLRQYLVLLTK